MSMFQQMETITGQWVAAAVGADKGTVIVSIIETKTIHATTTGTRPMTVVEGFGEYQAVAGGTATDRERRHDRGEVRPGSEADGSIRWAAAIRRLLKWLE